MENLQHMAETLTNVLKNHTQAVNKRQLILEVTKIYSTSYANISYALIHAKAMGWVKINQNQEVYLTNNNID